MFDIYLQQASHILGRSVIEPSGLFFVGIGIVVSAGLLLMVSTSLGEKHDAGFGSALVISTLMIALVPLVYMGLLSEPLENFFTSRQKWLMPMAVSISALTMGTLLLGRKFGMSILSGIVAVIPVIIVWILLIILLNNFGDALHSGEERMESIRGRTDDLRELIGE